MTKVIRIRDVPDEVHDALAEAAQAKGLSLAGYVRRELGQLARRPHVVGDNAVVVRQTQADVAGAVDRDAFLSALHEGRGG